MKALEFYSNTDKKALTLLFSEVKERQDSPIV